VFERHGGEFPIANGVPAWADRAFPGNHRRSVQQRRVRALNAALTIYGRHVAQAADGMERWQ
jgi:hypothetical protein